MYAGDEKLSATSERPFYVRDKGWTGAIDLKAGDILVLQVGGYVIVEKTQHEILERPITVYNFEVADFHTYYVGSEIVCVISSTFFLQRSGKLTGILNNVEDDRMSINDFYWK